MIAIDLQKLRNSEYLQYLKDYSSIVERSNPEALQVTAKYNDLLAKNAELDGLFKNALANEKTVEIQNLDFRRDQAVTGISFQVQAASYHFDETTRNAGQKLWASLELYGSGIAKQNYMAETATINSIIADWENKPDLTAAMNTLGLAAWKDELKTVNVLFNTKYLDRTEEYGMATPENIASKRLEANSVFYALRNRIEALHTLVETGTSPYIEVINKLNALTEQYNTLLRNRTSSATTEVPPTE